MKIFLSLGSTKAVNCSSKHEKWKKRKVAQQFIERFFKILCITLQIPFSPVYCWSQFICPIIATPVRRIGRWSCRSHTLQTPFFLDFFVFIFSSGAEKCLELKIALLYMHVYPANKLSKMAGKNIQHNTMQCSARMSVLLSGKFLERKEWLIVLFTLKS